MSDRDAIERAAARAWPAAESEERDGWLLRSTPTVDRSRPNSALPLRADAHLAVVEGWYGVRGRRPAVQVSPVEDRAELDAELERRGWEARWQAEVWTAEADLGEPDRPVAILTEPRTRWLDAWARCEQRDRDDVSAHAEAIFAQLGDRAAYALAPDGSGVALGVRDGALCGLFCVAVAEDARRGGTAAAMVRALAGWSAARTLYLQVENANTGGQAFWRSLGFTRAYGYRTRLAP